MKQTQEQKVVRAPDPQEIQKMSGKGGDLVAAAEAYVEIQNTGQYREAAELLTTAIVPYRKRVEEFMAPTKKAAHQLHRAIVAQEKELLEPADRAEKMVKGALASYDEEVERQRREAEAEARRIEEEKRREREERERELMAEAEAAMDSGEDDEAERLLSEAERAATGADDEDEDDEEMAILMGTAAPPPPETLEADGVSTRKDWDFEVLDVAKLPAKYLKPDLVAIRKVVRALGEDSIDQLGGDEAVKVYQKRVVAARSRG